MLNRELLLDILDCLNIKLNENMLLMDISIYGGSLMNLVYDSRPATKDIDAIFSSSNDLLLQSILEDIANIFSLEDNWLNQEIKEPLRYLKKEELSSRFSYSNLRVFVPSAEQMLAMKILAARPEPSSDFIDAAILCKVLNINTRSQVIKVVLKFLSPKLIGDRQLMFIKYLMSDIGGSND